MPTYTPSGAGVELRVTNAGRPQGKGPLTEADLASAIAAKAVTGSLMGPNQNGLSPAPTGLLALRIDTIPAAGNSDRPIPADAGPFEIVDMTIIRSATGNVGDTWRLQVQRQGVGVFADIYVAACFTAAATETAAGDYVARVIGTPTVVGEMRVVAGDVIRLVTTNGALNNSSARCILSLIPVA